MASHTSHYKKKKKKKNKQKKKKTDRMLFLHNPV